jgi:hypothetical protein
VYQQLNSYVTTADKQREIVQKAEKKATNKASGFKLYLLKVAGIMARKKLEDSKQAQIDYHENLQGISQEHERKSINTRIIKSPKKVSSSPATILRGSFLIRCSHSL